MEEMKITLDELDKLTKGCEEIPAQTESIIPTKLEEVVMEQKNVDALVKTLKFAGKVGNAVKESLEGDGKITITDAGNFLPVITALPGVISALPEIPAELADNISDEEKAEFVKAIEETGLIPENVEDAVSDGIKIAADIKNYVFKYFIK